MKSKAFNILRGAYRFKNPNVDLMFIREGEFVVKTKEEPFTVEDLIFIKESIETIIKHEKQQSR